MTQERVDPQLAQLAQSVYQQESSGGRNTTTSNAGAVGGMQIIPATFQSVADEGWDINDPVQNARAGVRYLNQMYERGGSDPRMAAIGYYGGPGAIDAARRGQARSDPRNPNAPDTFQYADQVTGRLPQEQGNWWEAMPLAEGVTEYSDGQGDSVRVPDQPMGQEPSGAERVGAAIMEIPRQIGLTARYGLEGLGQAAGVLTEPIRQGLNAGLRVAGLPEAAPTAQIASSAADALQLPQPQGSNERVVGDVARLMAGAGGIAGGSGALARGATGLTQTALTALGSNPAQQVASAAGAGGAGGAVREAGGSPLAQAGAGLLGGLAAPMALSGAQSVARGVQNRLPGPLSSVSPQQVEQRIEMTLRQSGVDWSRVPERIRQQLRQEAAQAMRSGDDLDPAAMARLLDFRRVEGATPTRGMLTQDPVQITREQNLAKMGANASDAGLQGLARVQNENNSALVRALNQAGAGSSDDAYVAGQRAIDALQSRIGSRQARINDLYSMARDSAGRSFPLDGRSFADRAIQQLDDNLLGGALPADVRNHINRISAGEVPFTVDYAEQLKTLIGRLQRNTSDGSARYALGLVRQALDDAPVMPLGQQAAAQGARAVNPGMLPATDGTELGEQAIQAFTQARGANRSLMRQIERTPALKAIYDGNVAPEQFVNKFIIGPGAKINDVQRLGRMLASEPQAKEAVRTNITQFLKDKALSGQADEVGKFSAAAYGKALRQLGDRKLGAFFDAQEVDQLKSIGRAASYMLNQPVGSAVNNSNTAAATLGRALDAMSRIGTKIPLGLDKLISGSITGLQQGAAQRITPALSAPTVSQPGSRLIPASVYGSLLAAPGIPRREDNQSP
ncbi:lytic transglycosylase domain-containing protein [Pusillimonas sp. SM2304]|uniref:lytic transglycosylase domain-containing protein n=1 Tax=Pusillimonas sp. SM2304 TaxID=3073241 RepID=UPI002876992B|nr:lytic transglycosylase domain-containing protein [Pusillimonas sp. SM2304]MDS1142386.1 lytic transglycosylase domain-containing protein [Pusillimonas sp. SM2304]